MNAATANIALQEAFVYTIVSAAVTQSKKRKHWCKEWLCSQSERGSFSQVFSELEKECCGGFETSTSECLLLYSIVCSPRLNIILYQ